MKKSAVTSVVVLVMMLVFSINTVALAVPGEEDSDEKRETIVDLGDYLDNEHPEDIVNILGLEKTEGQAFQGADTAFEKNGVFIEYIPDDGSSYIPIVCTSIIVKNNANVSYHGISCGNTKRQADEVLKKRGWVPYYENENKTYASYMKWENDKWYGFDIFLNGDSICGWYWLNWVQGDMGPVPFLDVSPNAWYYDSVVYVLHNWLMKGLDSLTFGPADNLARAQFAVILHRMNDEPQVEYKATFKDVADGQWYTNAILWAADTGVVTGYSNGNFGPSDLINREQMAVMMYRYANYRGYDTSLKADFSQYQDASYVSDYAREAMQWAVGNGIITGTDNGTRLNPQGNANRAECATIIMRFVEKYGK